MAGNILGKDTSIITLTSSGSSLTNLSGGSAGTDLDMRTSGNAAGYLRGRFELTCQWGTVTGITVNKVIAELYVLPKLDGTNLPQIDTTAGSSAFPPQCWFGNFTATKAPTASTDTKFVTREWDMPQELTTIYIRNVSGQTMSANWTLKFLGSHEQYT